MFFTMVKSLEQGATMSLLWQHGSRFNPRSPKEILVQYNPEFLSKQTGTTEVVSKIRKRAKRWETDENHIYVSLSLEYLTTTSTQKLKWKV